MKALLLYMLLLKATLTTFSGLASLPMLRNDLVLHRHLLTDSQLNTAIVVTRTTPGPVGVYLVSVGYFADGLPGACAEHPRVKGTIRAIVMASAGLLWAAAIPLARETATDPVTLAIILLSLAVLLTRKVESVWVILASGIVEITAFSLHLANTLH